MSKMMEIIKDDFYDTLISTKFELLKNYKRKRIQMFLILAVALSVIFYIIPKIWGIGIQHDTAHAFASESLQYAHLLIYISGALFAGDIISSEFKDRTILILFPTPQDRNSIFVGKYLAAIISTISVMTVYYIVAAGQIEFGFGLGSISTGFLKSYLFTILYIFGAVSLIFFFSSVLKRTVTSTILGLFSLTVLFPTIEIVLKSMDIEPWFIITHYSGFITDLLGVSSNTSTPDFYTALMVILAYTIIFFIMGLFFAKRRRAE